MPAVFKPELGLWRILSLPHIFGSEELSAQSPSIAERLPASCVLLNPQDATVLEVDTGDLIEICSLTGVSMLKIPVQIELTLPSGLLVITAGRSEYRQMNKLDPVTLIKLTQEDQL
jgi:NADH-quinone oxidoreductase subunit G